MKLLLIFKKIVLFIFTGCLFIILMIGTSIANADETPQILSIDRPFSDNYMNGVYYAQGVSLPIQVKTTDSSTYTNLYWNGNWKCDLKKGSTSDGVTTWNGCWVPTHSEANLKDTDFVLPTFSETDTSHYKKNTYAMVRTGIPGYSTTDQTLGYVTAWNIDIYKSDDSTFFYNNERTNSFRGLATEWATRDSQYGTYNCLGYAIDTCDYWQWPWEKDDEIYYPSDSEVINFMNGTDSGPTNSHCKRTWGTLYTDYSFTDPKYAEIIYYSNGHFAKVTSWDSDGTPTAITSKWGYGELIESEGYDPFNYVYGRAKIFFKN